MMDDLIKQAAEEYIRILNNSLPESEDCQHAFSKRFEKKMRHLIAKTSHPTRAALLRAAACLVAAILLLFGSVMAVDADAREAVWGWVQEQYTTFTRFIFRGDWAGQDTAEFYPGWIPEAYSFLDSYPIQSGQTFLYVDENRNLLDFTYSHSPENMEVYIYTGACQQKDILINGTIAHLLIPNDKTSPPDLFWQDSYGNLFIVSGVCKETELIRIAENILKK